LINNQINFEDLETIIKKIDWNSGTTKKEKGIIVGKNTYNMPNNIQKNT
jgi:hypothetical protein